MTNPTPLPDDAPNVMIAESKEVGAIAHLYRAEVYRSTIWRERLDQTTSWAVVSTGIGLSISFATALASPFPIVLVTVLCVVFLVIEARRYRFFYVWRFRARVLELTFYVPILRGEGAALTDKHGTPLSDDYIKPKYRITMARAIGRRLRRIYAYVFAVLGVAFLAKLAIHPTDVTSFAEFVDRAHIGPIPGWLALTIGTMFHVGWIVFAMVTWHQDRNDGSKMEDFLDENRAEVRMSDGG
jgi:uncharacterized membrane protein